MPRERTFILITLAVYAACIGVLVHFHEPWRDEASLWLAARELPPREILHYTGAVGSPATWPLILAPFARLGAPYETMGWVHAVIAVAAAAVLVTGAPFPRTLRVLAVFSYGLAYEYAVPARNYSLLALMLFTTAALYRRRDERPVAFALAVFGLFNTTAHGALLAMAVSAAVGLEWYRARRVLPLTILLAGAVVAAVQLWPPADGQQTGFLELRNPGAVVEVLTHAVAVPLGPAVIEPMWLAVNLAVLTAATAFIARRPAALAMWAGGLVGLFYVFVFKWVVPPRHAAIVLLWLLFVLWVVVAGKEGRKVPRHLTAALCVALVFSCIAAARSAAFDVRFEYSHGRQMAAYIRAHGLDVAGRPIAATNFAESVLPYLRCRQFWNVNGRRWQSYLRFDRVHNDNSFLLGGEVWSRVEAAFPDPARRPLVLSEWSLPYVAEHGYELRYQTEGVVSLRTGERFYLYAPTERIPPGDDATATAPATSESEPSRR